VATVEVAAPPAEGLWRIGRAPDPLAFNEPLRTAELDNPTTGNRFDSPLGTYRVLYFASTLDGCFGETLARFRPDVEVLAVIRDEWEEKGFMAHGEVPRDWRQRRIAVRVGLAADAHRFPRGIQFVDVNSGATREALRVELAEMLTYFGYRDLDAATVHTHDRRVTRYIGQWAYDATDEDGRPLYAGIRYSSRLDSDWECWAVFDDVSIVEQARQPILAGDPALQRVADRYNLRVY